MLTKLLHNGDFSKKLTIKVITNQLNQRSITSTTAFRLNSGHASFDKRSYSKKPKVSQNNKKEANSARRKDSDPSMDVKGEKTKSTDQLEVEPQDSIDNVKQKIQNKEELEMNDNVSVVELLDIVGKELDEDMEPYKKLFKDNLVKTAKQLKLASLDSWKKWNLPSGLEDGLKQKISLEKGSATQSLDYLCVVKEKKDEQTGLTVIQLKAPINPQDPSSDKLFIRKFYRSYLEAVRKERYAIVIGNPGIGKSMFQFYYLVILLNPTPVPLPPDFNGSIEPPKLVIRQVGMTKVEIYDIQARIVTRRHNLLIPEIESILIEADPLATLYFFEPEKSTEEPFFVNIPTMITVSPNSTRYHEFIKQKGAARLYMPVWLEDELLAVRNHILPLPTEEEVKERFKEFGGIFRYVFGSESVRIEARDKRKDEIDKADVRKLLTARTIEDSRVSHVIAKYSYIPTRDCAESPAFRSFKIDIVSQKVAEEMREKMNALSLNEKISVLMRNDECPTYNDYLCRGFYEDVIMERLLEGVSWRVRSNNTTNGYSDFTTPHLSPSTCFESFDKMEDNLLYRPLKVNFPIVEFFYKQNGKFYGFQVSREVGGKRRMAAQTLENFLNDLQGTKKETKKIEEKKIKEKKTQDTKSQQKKLFEEENITIYYLPSPKYADSATIKLPQKKIKNESFNKITWEIIKVPADYDKEFTVSLQGGNSVKE